MGMLLPSAMGLSINKLNLVKSERYGKLFYAKKPLRDKIKFLVEKRIDLML